MDKKFWEKVFVNYDEEILDVLVNDKKKIIKSHIQQLASPGKTVADIGCAIGKWLPFLSPLFKEVYAIDFSESNLDYAAKKYRHLKNIHYRNIDMTVKTRKKYAFDLVVCINAILIPDVEKREVFFKSLQNCINPGGHLLLVVPSFESFLFSEFIVDRSNRKAGININMNNGTVSKKQHYQFMQGIAKLAEAPTKHYLKEELITTLREHAFTIQHVDKIEYPWENEIQDLKLKLKDPYPWDWLVIAQRNKR